MLNEETLRKKVEVWLAAYKWVQVEYRVDIPVSLGCPCEILTSSTEGIQVSERVLFVFLLCTTPHLIVVIFVWALTYSFVILAPWSPNRHFLNYSGNPPTFGTPSLSLSETTHNKKCIIFLITAKQMHTHKLGPIFSVSAAPKIFLHTLRKQISF